jgi:hypothetical protein
MPLKGDGWGEENYPYRSLALPNEKIPLFGKDGLGEISKAKIGPHPEISA